MLHIRSNSLLRRLGISAGLVRLSAGLEDVSDLIADLKQALDRAG